MIKSFTIVNFLGESLKLELGSPEKSGFLIQSVTGIGPAKADINKTEVATNDGALYNSARVNSRNIVFNFIFTETEDGESIEDVRHKSYKYFPLKKGVDIIIETDKRLLKASGYVESNEVNIFSQRESRSQSCVRIRIFIRTERAGSLRRYFTVWSRSLNFPLQMSRTRKRRWSWVSF